MTSSFVLWMVYFSRLGASQFLRPISFRLISDRKEPIRIDRHMLDASTFSDLWKKKKKKKKDARSSNSIHKNNIIVYWKGLSWRWNTFFSRNGRKKKKKKSFCSQLREVLPFLFFLFIDSLFDCIDHEGSVPEYRTICWNFHYFAMLSHAQSPRELFTNERD